MANPGPAIQGFASYFSTMSNSQKALIFSTSLVPVSVAANTTAEQIFVLPTTGVAITDFVSVNKPTAQAGLGIVGVRVAAIDQIAITYANVTASPIVPSTEIYLVKAEKVTAVQSTFPY